MPKNLIVFIVASLLVGLTVGMAFSQQPVNDSNLWCQFNGETGHGSGKHIVLIAGDDEYRSEEALPMIGKILAVRHGFKCTVLFPLNDGGIIQPDFQTNIAGMDQLQSADLVILGLRFRNLPDDQMQHFHEYMETGKPVIGLRTSTHAFKIPGNSKYARYSFDYDVGEWKGGFGQRVLGDTWINHHGQHGQQSTRGVVNLEQKDHPVLKGVDDVWGPTDVYGIKHLPDRARVLLHGAVLSDMSAASKPVAGNQNAPMMPLAWTLDYKTESGKTSKIFTTTMGAATDFQSEDLRRLIVNAAFWCVGIEDDIVPDLNVAFVNEYKPSKFGFGAYRKNIKPVDYNQKSAPKK